MTRVIAVLCALWLILQGFNTYATVNRRSTTDARFCTLSASIVTFLDNSISQVTLAQAKKEQGSYEQAYQLYKSFITQLVDEAPCSFPYSIPPNLLKP